MSDYYKILEVGKEANIDEIKKSYRNLCKKYHPDVSREEDTEVKFREIQEAYEVLSDDDKRKNYDTFGSSGGNNPFGGGRHQTHGFNMDDIFTQFGDIFGGRYGQPKQRTRKGNDLRIQVNVTLEEVITGCKKKLKYNRQKPCNTCNGKGGSDLKNCLACNGSGQRTVNQQTAFGTISQTMPCHNCGASGQVVSNPCKSCRGEGTNISEETIDIDLPKGVASGMSLVMGGYGNHIRNGQPGDLQILVEEIPHNKFKREGHDLYCDEWISIPDAVLGATLVIPTIQGNVNLNIEPGCESGKVFSVGGKGTPVLTSSGNNYGTGNLYIKVNVKIPKNISDKEKEIYNNLKNVL
jgi:molecular chaperone DnaJ